MRGTSEGTGEHSMKEKANECIFPISRNPKNHINPKAHLHEVNRRTSEEHTKTHTHSHTQK
jgi:hypothetical protein